MGHKHTPGYHKTRVLNKVRLFDRFQSKESELDRFEKLRSCAALPSRQSIDTLQTPIKYSHNIRHVGPFLLVEVR